MTPWGRGGGGVALCPCYFSHPHQKSCMKPQCQMEWSSTTPQRVTQESLSRPLADHHTPVGAGAVPGRGVRPGRGGDGGEEAQRAEATCSSGGQGGADTETSSEEKKSCRRCE